MIVFVICCRNTPCSEWIFLSSIPLLELLLMLTLLTPDLSSFSSTFCFYCVPPWLVTFHWQHSFNLNWLFWLRSPIVLPLFKTSADLIWSLSGIWAFCPCFIWFVWLYPRGICSAQVMWPPPNEEYVNIQVVEQSLFQPLSNLYHHFHFFSCLFGD